MNLHALRLFCRVAETGSVTRAAEELQMSQPAVTSQIKKLEQEIAVVLLAPKGRGIVLTDAGNQVAISAKRLFSLESEIENYLDHYKSGSAGNLKIVATYLPANFLLPKWIAGYKQLYTDVEVNLTTTNSSKSTEQLLNYQADVAIIGGLAEFHPAIVQKQLFEDDMWFIVHKDHELASCHVNLVDIIHQPFVFREEGSSSREKLLSVCKIKNLNQPKVGLQFNGPNETIRAVLEGYGVTFVSALEVKDYFPRGDLARVFVQDVQLKNPISMCTRRDDILSPQALNFVEMLINVKSKANIGGNQNENDDLHGNGAARTGNGVG
ncbi:MAG: transcriptional regulator [Bacilli bacterium]|nr:transcriptional regulator [Bacilli bacterium]